jgi:hypothetical protein
MNRKEVFFISLTIFLTVLAWVLSDIYHTLKLKSVKSLPSASSLEIRFDPEIFDVLRKKAYE